MPFPNAIFDNTVFNIAAQISSCDLIALSGTFLFQQILVPQQILAEMQQFPAQYDMIAGAKMQKYTEFISKKRLSLELCVTYDPITLAFLATQNNIDKGEAEAIAQAQHRQIYVFFTDDEKFISNLPISYQHIRCYPTLFLIILLDINDLLPNYAQIIKEYFDYKPLPLKSGKTDFRNLYKQGLEYYSSRPDKKIISKKTSFKQLNINI